MKINIPKTDAPFGVRIVSLLILLGGMSVLGSALTDIFGDRITFWRYILRLLSGFLSLGIAYGLFKGRRWALWLYGLLVLIGFFVNSAFSVFLAFVFVFLFFNRECLKEGAIDFYIKKLLRINKNN